MSFADRLAQLDARERRLLGILGATCLGLALVAGPVAVNMIANGKRDDNQRLRDAITQIQSSRTGLRKQDDVRRVVETKYATPAPALAPMLEEIAKKHEVEIPETQDRPSVLHGKHYEERQTKITLRKVPIRKLVLFLEGVVQAKPTISLSRLEIKRRGTETDAYDVEVIVSAFDRKDDKKKSDKDKPTDGATPRQEETL